MNTRALAAVLAAALLSTRFPAAAAPPEGGGSSAAIRVVPERVYAGNLYTLRAELPGGGAEDRVWIWSASAGEMIASGAPEAHWRAPALPGKATIAAAALGEDGLPSADRAELPIAVEEPSTAGMVFIPAGTFTMGDTWTDLNDPFFISTFENFTDKPPHAVYLDGYWIDRNKTTNRQFAEFLNEAARQGIVRVASGMVLGSHEGIEIPFYYFRIGAPNRLPASVPKLAGAIVWEDGSFRVRPGMEDHPAVDATWDGAEAFARFHGKRLPTEAEWEKAARGNDGRRFPWGNDLPTKYHANVSGYYGYGYLPVGSFSPLGDSPYGVADVLGGFEWTNDWFDSYKYWDNRSTVPVRNPTGPEWGFDRSVRGIAVHLGSYGNKYAAAPLSFRYQWIFEFGHAHLFGHSDTGFRTAWKPPGAAAGKDR